MEQFKVAGCPRVTGREYWGLLWRCAASMPLVSKHAVGVVHRPANLKILVCFAHGPRVLLPITTTTLSWRLRLCTMVRQTSPKTIPLGSDNGNIRFPQS
ncbi:hypothetical protein CGRA01v4_05000 [Colletotrichum graminicola]|nr:hypothetical protein CGRA01v4_05000 [Colletotrichum graminicola]